MTPQPLTPARIEWDADGTARAPDFGDIYHPRAGAAAQAQQVFLAGNGLPARWRNCSDFTIAETGFGLGHNFIATWQAWRAHAEAGARLHYVAFEAHPAARGDLARAHAGGAAAELAQALLQAWPPLLPGVHRLDFDDGRVRLLLAFGDVRQMLPALTFSADAFYLDGFAPALNAAMWEPRVLQALGRRARAGATAATWSVARSVRDGLASAGFVCERVPGSGGKREVLRARHEPRFEPRTASTRAATGSGARRAAVVGAGVAGASVAAALASQGYDVDVFERHAAAAAGSSGNPAGLFHATLHAQDNPYARLHRAAALFTARCLGSTALRDVPHGSGPLLRLESTLGVDAMRARLAAQGLGADFVQVLDAAAAGALAGVPLQLPAWCWTQGSWLAPAALTQTLLQQPGVRLHTNADVRALRRTAGGGWCLLGTDGRVLADTPMLVLAAAERIGALLEPLGWPPFPLQRARGQTSWFQARPGTLRVPVAGGGYALQTDDGLLLCGASNSPDDDDPALRAADHRANFGRLQQLSGLLPPDDESLWQGRVGWRVQTADRLPLAGPLPAAVLPADARLELARFVPREPGLHLLAGLGARGLTLAPLLAEVVAARISGAPVPLEQDLVDQVDPARLIVRAVRRAAGDGAQRTRT